MEMQQIMELLLARFNAIMKEHMQKMKADQAKAKMEAKMDANQPKEDGKQEEMLARMRENIKSGQAEMRSTVCVIRSELETSNMK
jgi:septum formation inhibitor MinC